MDKDVKIIFKKDDIEKNYFEMYFYVNNINILEYTYNNEKWTLCWELNDMIDFLFSTLEFTEKDIPFPHKVSSNIAAKMEIEAREFDTDDNDLFDAYYESLNEWLYNHSWAHTLTGCCYSDLIFRKVDDNIEISWDNQDKFTDVHFTSVEGCIVLPIIQYIKLIVNTINSYRSMQPF